MGVYLCFEVVAVNMAIRKEIGRLQDGISTIITKTRNYELRCLYTQRFVEQLNIP